MRILDRYVLRSFLEPLALCVITFIGLLIIVDLQDNAADFIAAKAKAPAIAAYYLHQLPQFILLSIPFGILLALLFSLSKMSRANEVIAMLGAGRSVLRVLAPLIAFGVVASAACLWLNYELAPHADGIRKADLERIKKGAKKADNLDTTFGHLVKDRRTSRVWFARTIRPSQNKLEDLHISQLDGAGNIVSRWYAAQADYDARSRSWRLFKGQRRDFDRNGSEIARDDWSGPESGVPIRSITGWSETPQRLASSTMIPDQMSVPDLANYLALNSDFPAEQLAPYRTHWHYRWALPLACLAVVFVAAPLGIVYSRRGVIASVAGTVLIFFAYLMVMYLFLSLGKNGTLSPWAGAWLPLLLLFATGCWLLWLRSTNRELPKLSLSFTSKATK